MNDVKKVLVDEVEAAFDLLDRAMLSVEGRQRLLDWVIRNRLEAGGHQATEQLIATRLFDEMKANVRQAVVAFRDAIAPSRVAEAVAALHEFLAAAVPMLEAAEFDGLGCRLTAFGHERNRLSQPIPPPSPADEARRTVTAGWVSPEPDFLAAELRDGDTPLASFDARQATTRNGRVISRQELRERYRPASWTRTDTWFAQFPLIPAERE